MMNRRALRVMVKAIYTLVFVLLVLHVLNWDTNWTTIKRTSLEEQGKDESYLSIFEFDNMLKPHLNIEHTGRSIRLTEEIMDKLNQKESDFDDSCPDSTGRNEWLQYMRWFKKLPEVANITELSDILYETIPFQISGLNNVLDYKYDVKCSEQYLNSNLLLVKLIITQTHANSSVNVAGSNFRVEISSAQTGQVCGVKDFNNGTYLSCCQVGLYANYMYDYKISIYAQFVNFNAYTMLVSNSQMIWSGDITSKAADTSDIGVVTDPFQTIGNRVCNFTEAEWLQGFWAMDSKLIPQYVISHKRCNLPQIADLEFSKCVYSKYNGSFTLIGDSHMRGLYYYLVNATTGVYTHTEARNIDMNYHEMHFKWITVCEVLVEKMKTYVDGILEANVRHPHQQHLLVFDILAWDLMRNRYPTGMLPCIKQQILPLIHTLNYEGNVKMIFQDLTPRPDKDPIVHQSESYSSYIVGALNYYIDEMLRSAGVTVIRTWGAGMTWNENLVGGRVHIVWTDTVRFSFAPHGRLATDLAMYHACQ